METSGTRCVSSSSVSTDVGVDHQDLAFLLHISRTGTLRLTRLHVEDHLHRFLVERNKTGQAGQVEVVLYEILRDVAEVLVSRQRTEPVDPRQGVGFR